MGLGAGAVRRRLREYEQHTGRLSGREGHFEQRRTRFRLGKSGASDDLVNYLCVAWSSVILVNFANIIPQRGAASIEHNFRAFALSDRGALSRCG